MDRADTFWHQFVILHAAISGSFTQRGGRATGRCTAPATVRVLRGARLHHMRLPSLTLDWSLATPVCARFAITFRQLSKDGVPARRRRLDTAAPSGRGYVVTQGTAVFDDPLLYVYPVLPHASVQAWLFGAPLP